MKNVKKIFVFFTLVFLSGCRPLANLTLEGYQNDSLSNKNYTELNGLYLNYPIKINNKIKEGPQPHQTDQDLNLSLFNKLSWSKFDIHDPKQQKVKIYFVSEHKVIITLLNDHQQVEEITIRGKFKSGYFYSRPKIIVIPLFPLAYGYRIQRFRIGKSKDQLVLNFRINNEGFLFLLMNWSENGTFSAAYKRSE